MIYKKLISIVLLTLLVAPVNFAFAQDDDKTDEEKIAELKTNTRELLRETSAMALTLVSPTNRINFTVKSADILWGLDENDARAMFNNSVEDIKRLMTQVDLENNQQDQARNTNWARRSSSSKLRNLTSQVFAMRSALISSLANHDPNWAMRVFQETSGMFTNPQLVNRIKRDNKRLETTLIRKVAAKDVTKALELGREKLSKGVTSDVVSLLNNIYSKDKEKGADFAKDILAKLKNSTLKNNETWILVRLFQYGLGSVNENETPLFGKSDLRSLAELIGRQVTSPNSRYRNLSSTVMSGLETYSPGTASQVKRTFEQRTSSRNTRRGDRISGVDVASSKEVRKQLWEERTKFQNEISNNLNSLGNSELSDDERANIIDQTRNKILSVDDDSYRFKGLIGLARRVAGLGDKEATLNILNDAETYIKQDPRQRSDFSESRSLADAYALVDADRSFVILENMIYRLNGVINGYVNYMEFSGNGRIVENDELIMGRRSQQFTNNLKLSPQALRSLAENDFVRLKSLTEKFERAEIRVETRLLIANSLLSASQPRDNAKGGKTEKAGNISFD